MSETEKPGVRRRQVLKGAAWAAPVIASAATIPFASASEADVDCGCLAVGSLGAFSAQSLTALGVGTVTGTAIYNLDSRGCDVSLFQPAYAVIGLGGVIEFDDGSSESFTLGATAGVGTIGQISAITSPFTVLGKIDMPSGGGLGGGYPKNPSRICMNFRAAFVPIIPIPNFEGCTYTLCYDLDPASTGAVIFGTGTINWTDLRPTNPVLTVNA